MKSDTCGKSLLKIILIFICVLPTYAYATIIDSRVQPLSISGWNQEVYIKDGAHIIGESYAPSEPPESISLSGYDHILNVTGGQIDGNIRASGFRHEYNISGGRLGGNIELWAIDNVVNFFGRDLEFIGSPVNGRVTGILKDNSVVDLSIRGGASNKVNLFNVGARNTDNTINIYMELEKPPLLSTQTNNSRPALKVTKTKINDLTAEKCKNTVYKATHSVVCGSLVNDLISTKLVEKQNPKVKETFDLLAKVKKGIGYVTSLIGSGIDSIKSIFDGANTQPDTIDLAIDLGKIEGDVRTGCLNSIKDDGVLSGKDLKEACDRNGVIANRLYSHSPAASSFLLPYDRDINALNFDFRGYGLDENDSVAVYAGDRLVSLLYGDQVINGGWYQASLDLKELGFDFTELTFALQTSEAGRSLEFTNVVMSFDDTSVSVDEPSSILLLIPGLLGVLYSQRNSNKAT